MGRICLQFLKQLQALEFIEKEITIQYGKGGIQMRRVLGLLRRYLLFELRVSELLLPEREGKEKEKKEVDVTYKKY